MKMTKVTAGELTREQQRRMDVQLATVIGGPARATDSRLRSGAIR